jgi:uncharacterized protein (TIGR00369 family)
LVSDFGDRPPLARGAAMGEASAMARITVADFQEIVRESLPFAQQLGAEVEMLEAKRAVLRLPYRDDFLRPGGTISGPMLMGLADLAMYAVVLAAVGRVELAVTTSLTINFLRKPPPAEIRAEARLLKLGKRLAVGEVELYSAGDPEMVAHVTATYSIPPTEVL